MYSWYGVQGLVAFQHCAWSDHKITPYNHTHAGTNNIKYIYLYGHHKVYIYFLSKISNYKDNKTVC